MSNYKAEIKKNKDGDFFALVVRVDYDDEVFVCRGYKGRYFKTLKAAQKSTQKYIDKLDAA